MPKKRNTPSSPLEILKRIRGNWGNVKPFTQPHKDKHKYDRKRAKQNMED